MGKAGFENIDAAQEQRHVSVWVYNLEKQRSALFDGSIFKDLAITTLAFFLVALIPVVGAFVLIFVPLPMLYYYSKLGQVKGLAILALSLIISLGSLTILNAHANLPLIAALAAGGVIIAECLKKNYSLEKTVVFCVAMFFIIGVLFWLYQAFSFGKAPWQLLSVSIESQIRYSVDLYSNLNIASEQVNLIKENIPGIVLYVTMMSPALLLVTLTFAVWANLLAGRYIFRKYGLPYPDFGDLSSWKAPEKMVWSLIAAGVMILFLDDWLRFVGWNMLLVILSVYLFAGLAIVSFFLKKSSLPQGFRYLIYFLIFAQQIMTFLVVAAGLFDLWADFRKLNKTMEDSTVQ